MCNVQHTIVTFYYSLVQAAAISCVCMQYSDSEKQHYSFLFIQSICNLNVRSNRGLAALHLAVNEGYSGVVERLVGYGADLNVCVEEDGNTPLLLVMVQKKMKPLSKDTPHLRKVCTLDLFLLCTYV